MTKKEIIRRIAGQFGIDQTLTKKVVQSFLDSVIEHISETGRLELRNFGIFEVKHRAARKARNPKTNEQVDVPAKRSLTFRAGKNIALRLQNPPDVDSPTA